MKNILCVIALSVIALSVFVIGCTPLENSTDINQAETRWWIEEFDGHSYVIRSGYNHGYGSGIAHNPKCSCTSK